MQRLAGFGPLCIGDVEPLAVVGHYVSPVRIASQPVAHASTTTSSSWDQLRQRMFEAIVDKQLQYLKRRYASRSLAPKPE